MKKFAWIGLIIGFLLVFAGLAVPVYIVKNASVSIIGGADWPTYRFLLSRTMDGLFSFLLTLGVVLIITGALCLLLRNVITVHCSPRTTLVSLGLSAVGALGIICAFTWFTIVSFHEISRYPIRYPVSIGLGLACLMAFIGLIVGYIALRRRRPSVKGVLLDVATACLYLPVFLSLLDWVVGLL